MSHERVSHTESYLSDVKNRQFHNHWSEYSGRNNVAKSDSLAVLFEEAKIAVLEMSDYANSLDINDVAPRQLKDLSQLSYITVGRTDGPRFYIDTIYKSLQFDLSAMFNQGKPVIEINMPFPAEIKRSSGLLTPVRLRAIAEYFPRAVS